MRSLFGLVGLLVVLAIVALVAKRQLSSVSEIKLPPVAGTTPSATDASAPQGNVQQQAQQLQQQFKAAAEAANQQARPMQDEK
ncbi:MAG: hypothetical protein WCK83_07530 [Burkholderiales bacterium]